jgi:hypothetical protein
MWIQNVHQSLWDHEVCMLIDLQSTNNLKDCLTKNRQYDGERLKFKIHILFYGDNSWTIALRQTKFGTMKDDVHTCSFSWIIIFFDRAFEYGDGGISKLMRWMQNLHQSIRNHDILYPERASNNEQLLIRPFYEKQKIRSWQAVKN